MLQECHYGIQNTLILVLHIELIKISIVDLFQATAATAPDPPENLPTHYTLGSLSIDVCP